jgi:hypothetical protein
MMPYRYLERITLLGSPFSLAKHSRDGELSDTSCRHLESAEGCRSPRGPANLAALSKWPSKIRHNSDSIASLDAPTVDRHVID